MAYWPGKKPMGTAIQGIGGMLGGLFGQQQSQAGYTWQHMQQAMMNVHKQMYQPIYPTWDQTLKELEKKSGMHAYQRGYMPPAKTETVEPDSHEVWLHSRIERVRLRGREWLEGKRVTIKASSSGKVTSAVEEKWEGSGAPVKRLPNGDFVFTGEPPQEYLKKWTQGTAGYPIGYVQSYY